MASFLNTKSSIIQIKKLIENAEAEIVLIVPYIHTSKEMYNVLKHANDRGKEIIIIYRDKSIHDLEKKKLLDLNNLTLFHHPNIHCKCYYNGTNIIISSMNLYEYSEKNNREMSIELDLKNSSGFMKASDDYEIFQKSIDEMKEIFNGANLERLSEKSKKNGFSIDILKNKEEIATELAAKTNAFFVTKTFKPLMYSNKLWYIKCENYFDKIDVTFENRRISIKIRFDIDILKKKFDLFNENYDEYEIKGFKYYCNYNETEILLYKDKNFGWDEIQSFTIEMKKCKQGIDTIINKFLSIK